jgi:hypothetical protein
MYSNLSKIALVISSAFFTVAIGYYLYLNIPAGEDIENKASSTLISQFEEHAYYDISDSSAKLILDTAPNGQYKVACKEYGSDYPTIEKELSGEETVLLNLKPSTEYSCSINNGELSSILSGFKTKPSEYLSLSKLSADAYALGDRGLFRATWDSIAPAYLVTRIRVGDDGSLEYKERVILDSEYTDDSLKVGYSYEYQIRALSYPDSLGEPSVFKFELGSESKFEDIKISDNKATEVPFRNISSDLIAESIMEVSDIVIKKGEVALASTPWGFISVPKASFNKYKTILILDNNYKAIRAYAISTPLSAVFTLSGKDLSAFGENKNNDYSHAIFYNPAGAKAKIVLLDGKAELKKAYPYIFIEYPNGELIKVEQSLPPKTVIRFESNNSLITWDAEPFASSYLIDIKSNPSGLTYKVITSSPAYTLDQISNSEKFEISIYAYTPKGIKLLGKKSVTRISKEILPIRKATLEKAGTTLIITIESEDRYSHIIEISPATKDSWRTLTELIPGESDFFFDNVLSLESGSYKVRVSPKSNGIIGERTISNCELKVDKDINYQIVCK